RVDDAEVLLDHADGGGVELVTVQLQRAFELGDGSVVVAPRRADETRLDHGRVRRNGPCRGARACRLPQHPGGAAGQEDEGEGGGDELASGEGEAARSPLRAYGQLEHA